MTCLARAILLALPALVATAAYGATPCDAPEQFVRPTKLVAETGASAASVPLLRPYLLSGLPVVAFREEGGQRWLELAVHSAEEARRQLGPRAAAADPSGSAIAVRDDRVWLRCPAGTSGT